VDLSRGSIQVEELSGDVYNNFIGGDGLSGNLIFDEIKRNTNPFDSENRIIFSVGPFQGKNKIAGDAKFCISTKSPLTQTYANSMAGGSWGLLFKRTGYDALIIQGRAESPVFLWIHDEGAEICDAKNFWGLDTYESIKKIKEKIKEKKASVAVIGPAGEKLVSIACIAVDGHSFAGRCGIGAVMGSKNLKSVVVYGTKQLSVAYPDDVAKLGKDLMKKVSVLGEGMRKYGTPNLIDYYNHGNIPIKYWSQDNWEEDAVKKLSQPIYNDILKTKSLACLDCPIGCHRHIKVEDPEKYICDGAGPEYEAVCMLGMSNLVDNLKAVAKANDYCNRLGVDVVSAGAAIGFALECYDRGLITKRDTNGLELRWGDGDLLIELIKEIALKKGFGALFSEGNLRASKKIGKEAEQILMQVRGLDFPSHDPRTCWSMSVSYATNTRGACHCKGIPVDVEFGLFTIPELGFHKRPKFFDPKDKAKLAIACQDLATLQNSLSICFFTFYCGMTLTDILNLFNAITGLNWSISQLIRVGERSFNLQRLINIRDGKGVEYDKMPHRVFIPAVSGFRKDKVPPFDTLIDEYYELRGWDKKTGLPKKEKLIELGIKV